MKKLTQSVFTGEPEEYIWAAVDLGGCVYLYTRQPRPDHDTWKTNGGMAKKISRNCDDNFWWESLIQRIPQKERSGFHQSSELDSAMLEIDRLKVSHRRYEKLRRLDAKQFAKLFSKSIRSKKTFDELVDDLAD